MRLQQPDEIQADLLDIHADDKDPEHPEKLFFKQEDLKKSDYFKFGFVRNPWDRLVSCYGNKIKSDPDINNPTVTNGVFKYWQKYNVIYAGMPFHEFVRAVHEMPDNEAERHFRSQLTYLEDENDNILVDRLGRFENLNEDFLSIAQKLAFPKTELEHLTTS